MTQEQLPCARGDWDSVRDAEIVPRRFRWFPQNPRSPFNPSRFGVRRYETSAEIR
jgi:hypothetical protein